MKKSTKRLLVAGITGVLVCGSLYAFGLLNWTGENTLNEATQYLRQMTIKLVNQNDKIQEVKGENSELKNQINQLNQDKAALEQEIEDLRNQLPNEEDINKDQQIIELNNQIISKNNEIAHLTRQLQAANNAAATQQEVLDEVKQTLANEGINIYNMYE